MEINIGKIIREARQKKGMKQSELAKLLKVGAPAVSKWEKNEKIPGGDNLIKLANLLDIVGKLFPNYTPLPPSENFSTLSKKIEELKEDNKKLWQTVRLLEKSISYLEGKTKKP